MTANDIVAKKHHMHHPLVDTENAQPPITGMFLYPTDKQSVKNKVSAGIDNITDELLKRCKEERIAPLVYLQIIKKISKV